jgi:SPP1 family predicted phage head-tail adaptor
VKIGRMRQRVTLQSLTETPDSYGQRIQTWTTVGTYWAYLKAISGAEMVNGQQIKANVTHFVQMRYVGSVTPSMRILLGTRVINLVWVNNIDERNRTYEFQAQEVAAP